MGAWGCPDVNGKATTSLSCRCCSSSLVQEPWKKQDEGEEAAFYRFDWTNDLHRKCTHFNTPRVWLVLHQVKKVVNRHPRAHMSSLCRKKQSAAMMVIMAIDTFEQDRGCLDREE